MAIDYLSSDVFFVLGNLWSVTDKDVDLITKEFLEKYKLFDSVEKNRLCLLVRDINR